MASFLQPQAQRPAAGQRARLQDHHAPSASTTSIDVVAREPLSAGLRGLQLSGSGGIEGLQVPEIEPLPLDRLDWQIDAFARGARTRSIVNLVRLSSADLAVEVRGEVDPQTLAAAGQVDLTVDSLARLAAPFGQPVDGGAARSMPTWWLPSRPGGSMRSCRAPSIA